jgi:hypothetical protein
MTDDTASLSTDDLETMSSRVDFSLAPGHVTPRLGRSASGSPGLTDRLAKEWPGLTRRPTLVNGYRTGFDIPSVDEYAPGPRSPSLSGVGAGVRDPASRPRPWWRADLLGPNPTGTHSRARQGQPPVTLHATFRAGVAVRCRCRYLAQGAGGGPPGRRGRRPLTASVTAPNPGHQPREGRASEVRLRTGPLIRREGRMLRTRHPTGSQLGRIGRCRYMTHGRKGAGGIGVEGDLSRGVWCHLPLSAPFLLGSVAEQEALQHRTPVRPIPCTGCDVPGSSHTGVREPRREDRRWDPSQQR